MTLVEFLVGFSSPIVVAGVWFGLIQRVVPPSLRGPLYDQAPGRFGFPLLIVVACTAAGIGFWESRRPLSLGLAVALVVALVATALFARGAPGNRPGSGFRGSD
jgi:hypothetical protein